MFKPRDPIERVGRTGFVHNVRVASRNLTKSTFLAVKIDTLPRTKTTVWLLSRRESEGNSVGPRKSALGSTTPI